jgi:uncharacterized protein
MNYQERNYRNRIFHNEELQAFNVKVLETDLFVLADSLLTDIVFRSIYKFRGFIESYIRYHPEFLTSLLPLKDDYLAPDIIIDMLKASELVNVGPMACVAGAIAEYVGKDILHSGSKNVVIENGGDIFLKTEDEMKISIFAGESPLSERVRILLKSKDMPMGVCTSSGTVGHSLSFGKADAVCVLSRSAIIADAAATAIGNQIKNKKDIKKALAVGSNIKDIMGIIIIMGDKMAIQGKIEVI